MEEINLDRKSFKKMMTSKSLVPDKRIFINGDDLYKIYDYDIKHFSLFDKKVDTSQIELLSSLRKYIKLCHLPRGIIKYNNIPLGVIYDYFKGYKSFEELHLEDRSLIFNNIKCAIEAMNELISFDIYNADLISKNILYRESSVELIDLDGQYISSSEKALKEMNSYFLSSIYEIFNKKISSQYSKEDSEEIRNILRRILCLDKKYIDGISIKKIDEIESLQLIK